MQGRAIPVGVAHALWFEDHDSLALHSAAGKSDCKTER